MTPPYLLWDWNGTLIDDRAVVHEAINIALREHGFATASPEGLAERFARPLRVYFERLVGRQFSEPEWRSIHSSFRRAYANDTSPGALAPGAAEVLPGWRRMGGSQSLISLWPYDDLVAAARRHRVFEHFEQVIGRRSGHEDKREMIRDFLCDHALERTNVVLIGDTPDDAQAAHAEGIRAVITVGASLGPVDPVELAALDVPVAQSLPSACALALCPSLGWPRAATAAG